MFARVLAVVLGLQVSGAGHAAADLVASSHAAGEQEHCPPDGPCDDCPSGCPNCHCPNFMRSVAAPASDAFAARVLPALVSERLLYDARAPGDPALPSLFRPPRPLERA